MTLDKMGNPYTPMSEAERAVMRNRPYPESFIARSQRLAKRETQRAKEPARVRRVEETRAAPEPMGTAIKRHVVKRGK